MHTRIKYLSAILVVVLMLISTGCGDSGGGDTSTPTVTQNTSPVAKTQYVFFSQNSSGNTVNLTGTDFDGDSLTFSIISSPSNGSISGTAPNLLYTPNVDFSGSDTLVFKVNDGTIDSATGSIYITVENGESVTNTLPVANNQNISVDMDSSDNAITLSASDVDGDTLTYTIISNPTNGTISGTAPNLLYTPNSSYIGNDSFTFKANDGTGDSSIATVSIVVASTVANSLPIANDQNISIDMDSSDNAITLSASDVDADTLTYTIVSNPINGTISGTAPNLLYTPNILYMGDDSFTFKVNDGFGDSNTAIVNIKVGYGEVTSPFTSRVWMDRNLGSPQICTNYYDTTCYGDYYQWGREADGHQELNSTTTTVLATDVVNVGSDFILDVNATGDWTTADIDRSLRSFNWSKTDGASVCPIGFRVPTTEELLAELDPVPFDTNTSEYLYEENNFLKLSTSGFRLSSDGTYTENGFYTYLYTVDDINHTDETIVLIDPNPSVGFHTPSVGLVGGKNVRCIKD